MLWSGRNTNTIKYNHSSKSDSNPQICNGKLVVRRAHHWAIAITDKYKFNCVLALSPRVSGTSLQAPADRIFFNREPVTLLLIQIPNNHLRYAGCSLPSVYRLHIYIIFKVYWLYKTYFFKTATCVMRKWMNIYRWCAFAGEWSEVRKMAAMTRYLCEGKGKWGY